MTIRVGRNWMQSLRNECFVVFHKKGTAEMTVPQRKDLDFLFEC